MEIVKFFSSFDESQGWIKKFTDPTINEGSKFSRHPYNIGNVIFFSPLPKKKK